MRHRVTLLFALAAACARGEASESLGRVVVDTVGHGILRTMTESPTGWRDTSGWKLVEVGRIVGGTDAPGELIDPQDVALAEDGTIFVADNSPAAIKVYTPAGHFIRTIGREGQGPGEFSSAYLALHEGRLFVHDPGASRTSLFDTAGTFIRTWPTVCCVFGPLVLDSAGHVGLPAMAPRTAGADTPQLFSRMVKWYGADSTQIDSTLVPAGPEIKRWVIKSGKNNMMMTTIPWVPNQLTTFLGDRRMLVGYAASYQVAVAGRTGKDTTALFGRRWTPMPIPDVVRKEEVERRVNQTKKNWDERAVRNAFLLSDVPTTAPAYDWFGLDGRGDTWVRTPLPGDTTRTLFDVFDPAHRWLGQVSGSGLLRAWGMRLAGDHMLGYGEDGEGNPVVVVYRIERGG